MSTTKPTHEVFVVIDNAYVKDLEAKSRWTKIGVGFFKNDGMTLLLDAVPITPRMVIRPITSADKKGGAK